MTGDAVDWLQLGLAVALALAVIAVAWWQDWHDGKEL
jgi:hypothetical protein